MEKTIKLLILISLILCIFAFPVIAESIPVDSGLSDNVDKDALAMTIKDIFITIGYFIGVVAVGSLIFNGFKIATAGNEAKRAEAKTHIFWTLGAVVLVGLAIMIVSFVAGLIPS